jgi:hypothetical protein
MTVFFAFHRNVLGGNFYLKLIYGDLLVTSTNFQSKGAELNVLFYCAVRALTIQCFFPEAEFMNVQFVEVSGHNLESSQTQTFCS